MKEYDIIIEATISIGGKYMGDDVEEAIGAAKFELRSNGEIDNVDVIRAVYLDPNPDE